VEIPARPQLLTGTDKRYAQYSETRVAGATYGVIGRLGGGQAGLKRLLGALPSYRRDGHSVWTARDLRDMTVQAFERSGADNVAVSRIFAGQGIGWGRRVTFGVPLSDPEFAKIMDAQATLIVRVDGPGGFDCRTTTDIDGAKFTQYDGSEIAPGLKRGDGGLGYSGSDDCYLVSGTDTVDFANPHTFGVDAAELPFPFLAGQAHWSGEYAVHAKYVCEFQPGADPSNAYCPATMQVLVAADTPVATLRANEPGLHDPVLFTLARGAEAKVATFEAKGKCQVVAFDCGV
jgi:hypothetical protein